MQCHNANFDQVFNRFDRLWLKNEPIATVDPVTQEDIAVPHKHVCSLFSGVDPLHIQKKDVQKNETGQETLSDDTCSTCFKFTDATTKNVKTL